VACSSGVGRQPLLPVQPNSLSSPVTVVQTPSPSYQERPSDRARRHQLLGEEHNRAAAA
jgi:hypothetical protein